MAIGRLGFKKGFQNKEDLLLNRILAFSPLVSEIARLRASNFFTSFPRSFGLLHGLFLSKLVDEQKERGVCEGF